MSKKEKLEVIRLLKKALSILEGEQEPTVFDEMDKTINEFLGKWLHEGKEE